MTGASRASDRCPGPSLEWLTGTARIAGWTLEQTTDKGGYIEIIFALFDLVDPQFSPHIRNPGDQPLHQSIGAEPIPISSRGSRGESAAIGPSPSGRTCCGSRHR